MFGQVWTEHVYKFTPVGLGFGEISLTKKDPYEIRIYRNSSGGVIWVTEKNPTGFFCGDQSPEIHKDFVGYEGGPGIFNYSADTAWVGWKRSFKRSFSDVRFLLSFERTREDFLKKITENRETYLLYTPETRGSYSGSASLKVEELKALGFKVCHRAPTKRYPDMAPGDYVNKNFNWGAPTPKEYQWFRHGAGYRDNGNKGCNSGCNWYA